MAGPRKGNRNAIKHGLSCLTLGALPAGKGYIGRQVNELRRVLEDEVFLLRKVVTLSDSSLIDAICKWQRHGELARVWLKEKAAVLSPDQLLAFSRDVARAASERHRLIKELGLDAESGAPPWANENALEAVGSEATVRHDQCEAANDPNAAQAKVDVQEPTSC